VTVDISWLSDAMTDFLAERHLGALTTRRRDGSPHVVAVGFTFDGLADGAGDHQ